MIAAQLRKMWLVATVSVCLASTFCSTALAQTTIHVPAEVPSIPQAISQAQNGDTVLVSPGTYVGNFTFQGKAITVASTDGPSVTILDATNVSSGPTFQNGEGPQSVLRGFTITNGSSASEGAGVFIQGASPTIENNIITGNHGCEGIGITADNSSAIIRNNVITNNTPAGCTGLGGGGIKISGPGNAQILNNTITGNQVGGQGGGIELNSTTLVTITGNTIQNNSATNNGGGISVENGSQATIVNNLITANTGFLGSGIYLVSSLGNQNVLVNNTIAFNVFQPGVTNQQQVWMTGDQTGTQFVNNVIADGTGGGAVGCDPGSALGASFASNDILSTQPTTPPQPAPPFAGCLDVTGTNGNISLDPQFVNPVGNDYHLQSTSPVIDVGSNSAPDLADKDLDGNARIGPGNASTCVGIVDMGAYEFALTSSGTGFLTGIQDFGTVVVGTSSSPQTINAFVQGCVQIASVKTTGDFSQTNTCGHALSSSTSCTIQVTFTPIAGGQRTGSLTIDFGSSAPSVSTSLSGTGLVVPPSVSPASLAFGNQVIGSTSVAQTVTVSGGGGTSSLQITSVSIAGDYTQTNSCFGPPIAAPNCLVNVSFAPIGVGSRPGSMVINTNQGTFSVSLSGTGINPIGQIAPSSLSFGNQLLNTSSAPQAVTLTNTGVGPLQILGFTVNGDFALTNNCGSSLDQGASCTINVTFTPTAVGARSGGFSASTNNGMPGVGLSGTGVVPAASLSSSALTFAGQLLNTTSSVQAVTLSNTGGASLLISSIAASGDFAQTNTCPASLGPGAGCTINVSFTPVARGSRTGTLTVNSNTFGAAPTVSLSGTGQAILVTPSPASLTFPLTAVNTTSDAQSVTLINSGDLPVTIAAVTIGLDYAQTNNCGTSLDVGASCTFNITFTPSIGGPDNDTLTINGNFGSPVVVALNGSGQTQGPSGTLSPAFLVFPNQAVGTTSTAQTLTYTNTGATAVSISDVMVAFGPFAQTNACPASLSPANSCTINITFTPTDTADQGGVLAVDGTGSASAILAGSSVPQLVSPTTLDFGHQAINSVSPVQTITFTNTTNSPITIGGLGYPLPFNLVNHCPVTVEAGASCTFDATFAPKAHGSFAGFVNISGNFTGSPATVPIVGTATGIGGTLAPASLTFASQVVGTTSGPQTVTLTNTGAITLGISSVQTTGDFAQTNSCPATLLPGASCTVNTTFTPTDVGARTGTLTVSSNATFAIPPVALSGTGAAPAIGVFSPQSLTFGSVNVGAQSAAQTVTLSNVGTATLSVGLATTGPFSQTNNCPGGSLAPGASCSVNVVFAPTASGNIGGSLILGGNSTPAPSPVTLTGTGIAPTATYSTTSLSFAPQLIGTSSAAQSLTLTNSGTATLTISSLTISSIGTSDFSQTNNCGSSLTVGASCTINVIFAPLARGSRSAALSLASNSLPVPPAVNLSGTGQAIQLNPSTGLITFPAQLLNTTSAPQQIPFTNNGDLPVTITVISATGDFAQTNNCPATLAVGAGCTVTLTFTPTARGTRTGELEMGGNFTGSAPFLALRGTGQALQGSVSATSVGFPSQLVNTTSTAQSVTLTNSGDLPLSINTIATTGDYAETNNCGTSLAVGASCRVTVTFTPTAPGTRIGSLVFNTSSGTPVGPLNLVGSGTVAPPTISPTSLTFAPQPIGTTSVAQTVTVSNTGSAAISITSITVGNSDFSQTNNCSASLAANASCSINVTFTPAARGSRSGGLTIAGNFNSTAPSVTLSGTGQVILATASPASLTFAAALLNTASSAQAVTFTNSGDTTATITGVSITGDFAQTNTCGTSLGVGASCTVNVTFTPTARGSRTGTVTLQGNFTSAAPVVNLTGTGQAALASFNPASFDFGNVAVGTASAISFTYSNTGDLALSISGVSVPPDFSQTNNCPQTLATNTNCLITVTFVPRSAGTQTASLTVSGTVNSSVSLTGTGVMPLATLSPASLSFGNQRVGTVSAPQVVTVTNTGTVPLFVNGSSVSSGYQETNNCSSVLAVGASCTLSVVFAPTSAGTSSGTLIIGGNLSATPSSVSLSGTGLASVASLVPATLTFGNQIVGTISAAQTLTLTSIGNTPINLSGIQASGDFAQTNNCGVSLAPGSSCTIVVTFTPTVHGARGGTITVSGDFTGAAPSATLSGSGTIPTASSSPSSLSFANQLVNSASTSQGVTLTNSGDGPLSISAIAASGDFAQTNSCGSTLAPGASCTITVTFAPSATGARSGTLSLTSNSSVAVNPITLSGTGVAPGASLSPATLSFANQLVNTSSAPQGVTLTNTGTATLNIKGIALTGEFSESANCGSTLAAGASCTVTISFMPTATGTRTGTLTITDDQLAGGQQTVTLDGTGVAPAASVSPAALAFGNQRVNTSSAAQNVTLSNTGTATLTILGISLSGMTSEFSQTNNCGANLTVGASCTINVVFNPTQPGARTAALTVSDDPIAGGQQTINLSGMGVLPNAGVSPSSVSFGNQLLNTSSASQVVTLRNAGTDTLTISSFTITGDFSQTNNCGATLAPNTSCPISIAFTPTAAGSRSGVLTVTDDSFFGAQQTVNLSGTGVAPAVTLSTTALTFGNSLINTSSLAAQITLTNSGSATLNISSFAITGDFSQTNNCGATLAAGSNCAILVTFTPTVTGSRTGTLTISDDPLAGGQQTVSLSGTGVAPAAAFSPGSLSFANQLVNSSSSSQSVTLSNTGTATLTISGIAVSGDFSQTNNCGSTLAAGATCTVSVTFTPNARGSRTGALTVNSNASGSTPTVSLAGTGIAPVASVSSTPLTFGNQVVNTTSGPLTVQLTNTGDATLNISGISTSGSFSQTNNCGASLAGGASCVVGVKFIPTSNGNQTGVLTIADNALGGSPQTVGLSGTGISPAATFAPSSLTFSSQQVNTSSASQTLTVTSTGVGPLSIAGFTLTGDFSQTNNCGPALNAGATCSVFIVFTPTARGNRTGSITLSSNALGAAPVDNLSGTGVAPVANVSATSLSFSSQLVNTASGSKSVNLNNSGDASLHISGISINGDFAQTNNCPAVLAKGANCQINVTFTPTVSGSGTGVLSIADDSLNGSTQTVSLSGVGVDYSVSASPASATVTSGQSVTFTVTVAALGGNYNQSVSLACSGLPPASSCHFAPSSVTPNSGSVNSTLKLSTTAAQGANGTPAGSYSVTINGTGQNTRHSTTLQLIVN